VNTHIAQDSRPRLLPYLAPRQGDNRLPYISQEITPLSEPKGKFLWQRNALAPLGNRQLLTGPTQSPLNLQSIAPLHHTQPSSLTGFW
jgi:hypothetical protein